MLLLLGEPNPLALKFGPGEFGLEKLGEAGTDTIGEGLIAKIREGCGDNVAGFEFKFEEVEVEELKELEGCEFELLLERIKEVLEIVGEVEGEALEGFKYKFSKALSTSLVGVKLSTVEIKSELFATGIITDNFIFFLLV